MADIDTSILEGRNEWKKEPESFDQFGSCLLRPDLSTPKT